MIEYNYHNAQAVLISTKKLTFMFRLPGVTEMRVGSLLTLNPLNVSSLYHLIFFLSFFPQGF